LGSSLFVGVPRFDPPNAAEACQFATGLNRWSPFFIVAVTAFGVCFAGSFFGFVVLGLFRRFCCWFELVLAGDGGNR